MTTDDANDFTIEVIETDAGWTVSRRTGDTSSVIETYPTEDQARFAAEQMEGAATRYDGAASVRPAEPSSSD